MSNKILFAHLILEVLTGCGPGELGWGTGVWVGDRPGAQRIFHWDWRNSTEAEKGHQQIVSLLKTLSAELEQPIQEERIVWG
jgi:hypothetical protein